jgi:GNAT superfamily N-acetyltransferase
VLVEDEWQRRGVGTALVTALVGEARGRAVRSIHADLMGQDHLLVGILGRLWNSRIRLESGIFSVDIGLSAAA